jgi:hypothetical protein
MLVSLLCLSLLAQARVASALEAGLVPVDHRGALLDLEKVRERMLTWRERADRRGRTDAVTCLDNKLTMIGALEAVVIRANLDAEASIASPDSERSSAALRTIRLASEQVGTYQRDALKCYRL